MKLSEITQNKKYEIIQWFIDSKTSVDGLHITQDSLLRDKTFQIALHNMADDTLNFPDSVLVIDKFPNRPMPFKFGSIRNLTLRIFDTGALKHVDFNNLNVESNFFLRLIVETDIDLKAVVTAALPSINYNSEYCQIICDNYGHRVNNLIPACSMLGTKTVTISIETAPIDGTLTLFFKDGDIVIYVEGVHFGDATNVMDLQEWLFDNGYEDLL